MNSKERFGALMQGQLPDRVPVLCNMLEQGARELGMSIKEYYSKGEYVAEGQLKLVEKFGYDGIWGAHYAAREAEILGSRNTIYSEIGPPNVGDMVLKRLDDIEKFEIPKNIHEHPKFIEEKQTVSILKEEVGNKYPILSYVTGSFTLPSLLMGTEKWIDLLLCGPENLRREILQKCSDFCISRIKALKEIGVDLIAYANPFAGSSIINLGQFKDLALEWIVRDSNSAGADGIVYFNGGGKLNPMIKSIINETDIGAVYISPMDDITEAKQAIAGNGLLAAAINDINLTRWSDDEIEQEVKKMMQAGAPGGGFVFGTLVMPFLIPESKIKKMLKAAFKFGQYDG